MGCSAWQGPVRGVIRGRGRWIRAALPAAAALLGASGAGAQALVAPSLANVAFGAVPSLYGDLTSAQNTCSFTGLGPVGYSVGAAGSGAGGAFTLTNGTSTLPYEVQWAQTANATSGSALVANTPLTGQTTAGLLNGLTCLLGVTNATLIVIVRAASLQRVTAGAYTGTLTVLMQAQ